MRQEFASSVFGVYQYRFTHTLTNMNYLVTITNWEFGQRDYKTRVEAGNPGTAVNRAWRETKKVKPFGTRRLKEFTFKVTRI